MRTKLIQTLYGHTVWQACLLFFRGIHCSLSGVGPTAYIGQFNSNHVTWRRASESHGELRSADNAPFKRHCHLRHLLFKLTI
ncbi:hypothetical protein F5Y10DRAFT_203121 [Nemania abortiva]|nr:hypothetical protein F5Y10DRAFT_203121 [Nemania abortiva]